MYNYTSIIIAIYLLIIQSTVLLTEQLICTKMNQIKFKYLKFNTSINTMI